MEKFIGKALLQVHSDKDGLKNKPLPSLAQPASLNHKHDIRNRIVFKQNVNSKVVHHLQQAGEKMTSMFGLMTPDADIRLSKDRRQAVTVVEGAKIKLKYEDPGQSRREKDGPQADQVVTLFVRNLPDNYRNQRQVCDLLPSKLVISGMRIDTDGTAEVYFCSRADAEQAESSLDFTTDSLNQTKIQGRTVKAHIVDDLNRNLVNHRQEQFRKTSRVEERRSIETDSDDEETHSRESVEQEKQSIFKRIRKVRK